MRLALVLLAACGWDANRMNDQPRCEPGDRTPWLPDQRCDQAPPPNVVAWREIVAPVAAHPPSPTTIARGADRFSRFCAPCHGPLGDGNSAVARDMVLRPPRSLHDPKVVGSPDGELYRTIVAGYGMMPAYGTYLGESDRWAIVHYVRVLERSQATKLAELPAPHREEAQRWLP
jgi:mono/diheme cytochrome c family protein